MSSVFGDRFPTPLNDCYAAVQWTARHYDLPLVVMGDSAGGKLSAVISQMTLADGSVTIAAQVLIYPLVDCAAYAASYFEPENQLFVTKETGDWFLDQYLPQKALRTDPRASPLRAPDLSGLPPAIVVLASHDVLRDEGQAHADRLMQAGVSVKVTTAQGEIHGFFVMGGIMPAAGIALDYIARHLENLLIANPA